MCESWQDHSDSPVTFNRRRQAQISWKKREASKKNAAWISLWQFELYLCLPSVHHYTIWHTHKHDTWATFETQINLKKPSCSIHSCLLNSLGCIWDSYGLTCWNPSRSEWAHLLTAGCFPWCLSLSLLHPCVSCLISTFFLSLSIRSHSSFSLYFLTNIYKLI